MKVILRTDIANLGTLGDTVDVRPGYGRNYLLPQGYAMLATPANVKVFGLERKKLEAKTMALRGTAAALAAKIAATGVTIAMRVGDNDKLYGSVTSNMIADVLLEKGIDVDRRRILLDAPVRSLGNYVVRVRLHADVVAELALSVVAERTYHDDEAEAAAADKAAPAEDDNANKESAPAEEIEQE